MCARVCVCVCVCRSTRGVGLFSIRGLKCVAIWRRFQFPVPRNHLHVLEHVSVITFELCTCVHAHRLDVL